MSLALASPGGPLWKDSSLDSAETRLRNQPGQPPVMLQQQQMEQPAAAATLEAGLIWPGSGCLLSGQTPQQQQQEQCGMSPFVSAGGSALPAAPAGHSAGTAGCCHDTQTLPEELGSDEADFDIHGLAAVTAAGAAGAVQGGGTGAAQQQQGAAGESEPVATKQFTASSKKQLTSKFRGVCWNKKNKRWQAAINSGGKYIYLGSFTSENDAARQFDRAAIKIRGKKAKLNFPARDYVDEDGNLLEDFELPAPAGNGKPVSTGGNSSSSKNAAPKPPSMSTQAYPQQQQQLEIKPLAVDASRMQQQYSFGGQQLAAAADGGWQHNQMLMQQHQQQVRQQQQHHQQQHMWHEQQQQQQQQSLQNRQLLKSQTWQEHLLSQHSQQMQAQQTAGCFSGQLLHSKSLPTNTAAVNGATDTAAAPGCAIANQAALIRAQRMSGQPSLTAADGCSSQELLVPAAAAATASLRQGGVAVTTSVGFGGNSSGVGSFAGMVQDMQQHHQQQMLAPELTVAELDLPPLVPLMPSGSMAGGSAMHMQQQQQMLSMAGHGIQPNQQQHQLGATWQQQQQQLQSAASNGCSGMLHSFGSSASAAQQYAQQSSAPQLQMTVNVNGRTGTGAGVSPAQTAFNNGSLHALGSDGSAHAVSMSTPMQQPAHMHLGQTGSVSAPMLQPAAMHQQMHLNNSSSLRPSSLTGQALASHPSSSMGHAPGTVTHALSARMASCELGEAIQLARQAAAAQGVTDFTGALRQMSSAQLPVVTTASGCNLQVPQQQQNVQNAQNAAAGGVASSGLLQYQGSGMSVSVSSMSGGTSSCGLLHSVGMQVPVVQPMASHASTGQGPAAAAAASTGSPTTATKHASTQDCGVAVATGCDAAAAAPASKRARTSSLHDDGQAPSCN